MGDPTNPVPTRRRASKRLLVGSSSAAPSNLVHFFLSLFYQKVNLISDLFLEESLPDWFWFKQLLTEVIESQRYFHGISWGMGSCKRRRTSARSCIFRPGLPAGELWCSQSYRQNPRFLGEAETKLLMLFFLKSVFIHVFVLIKSKVRLCIFPVPVVSKVTSQAASRSRGAAKRSEQIGRVALKRGQVWGDLEDLERWPQEPHIGVFPGFWGEVEVMESGSL